MATSGDGVRSFVATYNGNSKPLAFPESLTLSKAAEELQREFGVIIHGPTLKLLYRGKAWQLSDADVALADFVQEGQRLLLLGTEASAWARAEQAAETSAALASRTAGFEEERRRQRQRERKGGRRQPPALPTGPYVFRKFRTLELPGLHPPASRALIMMHTLAADPGIRGIMNKYRWTVGIMTEMPPVGLVGVSPMCLLGYNKNFGQEISLRLRTDDMRGFRRYQDVRRTLIHELTHMVHSEHDVKFNTFCSQLTREAAELDWTRRTAYTTGGGAAGAHRRPHPSGALAGQRWVQHLMGGGSDDEDPDPMDQWASGSDDDNLMQVTARSSGQALGGDGIAGKGGLPGAGVSAKEAAATAALLRAWGTWHAPAAAAPSTTALPVASSDSNPINPATATMLVDTEAAVPAAIAATSPCRAATSTSALDAPTAATGAGATTTSAEDDVNRRDAGTAAAAAVAAACACHDSSAAPSAGARHLDDSPLGMVPDSRTIPTEVWASATADARAVTKGNHRPAGLAGAEGAAVPEDPMDVMCEAPASQATGGERVGGLGAVSAHMAGAAMQQTVHREAAPPVTRGDQGMEVMGAEGVPSSSIDCPQEISGGQQMPVPVPQLAVPVSAIGNGSASKITAASDSAAPDCVPAPDSAMGLHGGAMILNGWPTVFDGHAMRPDGQAIVLNGQAMSIDNQVMSMDPIICNGDAGGLVHDIAAHALGDVGASSGSGGAVPSPQGTDASASPADKGEVAAEDGAVREVVQASQELRLKVERALSGLLGGAWGPDGEVGAGAGGADASALPTALETVASILRYESLPLHASILRMFYSTNILRCACRG
eukprot:jgi/Mesvir1/25416/Mv14216-RA.2